MLVEQKKVRYQVRKCDGCNSLEYLRQGMIIVDRRLGREVLLLIHQRLVRLLGDGFLCLLATELLQFGVFLKQVDDNRLVVEETGLVEGSVAPSGRGDD